MRTRRIRWRRAFALAFLPVTAATTIGIGPAGAAPDTANKATVSAKGSVRFGDHTNLRGQFPGSADAEVAILQREAGEGGYHRVGTAHTNGQGRWKARVKPRHTGDWRAQLAAPAGDTLAAPATGDTRTGAEKIRVRSVTHVGPAKRDVVAGDNVEVRGKVQPAGQRDVIVEVGGQSKRAHADKKGHFEVDWKAPSAGTYKVKAHAKGNKDATGSKDAGGSITAYRYAEASWYGPGFYGHRTACGQTLTSSTRGVANKSLPCGTKLTLRYGGKSVNVRVIDRGPYSGNREFDLTEATKNDLGFPSTGRVLSSR